MAEHIEGVFAFFILFGNTFFFLLRAVYSINLQPLDLGKDYKVTARRRRKSVTGLQITKRKIQERGMT